MRTIVLSSLNLLRWPLRPLPPLPPLLRAAGCSKTFCVDNSRNTKEKNALPEDLLEEIALHAMHRGENRQGKVIVDLCAGYQSWAPVAERLGCTYVAIDLLGDRNVTHHKRMGHRKIALTTRVEGSSIPELTMEELEELEVLIRTELGDREEGS